MGDGELERFKAEINLVELASYYGYECIRKESSRASVVMAHPDGDKIVVATATDGHGVFFSVREDQCGGSVIDLVMHREQVQLGRARLVLRRCLSSEDYLKRRSAVHYRPQPLAVDRSGLYARWLRMQPYDGNYLQWRGLSQETIAVFADRIRLDERGNVAFRHDDLRNFAGWEMKNKGFTGFSSGGKKALFGCRVALPERAAAPLVVVAESAIDVLSYYQLHPQPGMYLSFAGAVSRDQQALLVWVLERYPGARIIIATDSDDQGKKYAEWFRSIRADAEYDCPPIGKDWNDVLNNRSAKQVVGTVVDQGECHPVSEAPVCTNKEPSLQIGDAVIWKSQPRGGYGYIYPVDGEIVRVGETKVTIRVQKKDGTEAVVAVSSANLIHRR